MVRPNECLWVIRPHLAAHVMRGSPRNEQASQRSMQGGAKGRTRLPSRAPTPTLARPSVHRMTYAPRRKRTGKLRTSRDARWRHSRCIYAPLRPRATRATPLLQFPRPAPSSRSPKCRAGGVRDCAAAHDANDLFALVYRSISTTRSEWAGEGENDLGAAVLGRKGDRGRECRPECRLSALLQGPHALRQLCARRSHRAALPCCRARLHDGKTSGGSDTAGEMPRRNPVCTLSLPPPGPCLDAAPSLGDTALSRAGQGEREDGGRVGAVEARTGLSEVVLITEVVAGNGAGCRKAVPIDDNLVAERYCAPRARQRWEGRIRGRSSGTDPGRKLAVSAM